MVCRSGVKKLKLESLSITQWSSANLAILYKLVQEGSLEADCIFDYLSYTSYMYNLFTSHEAVSVLYYDREYRRLQHIHNFRWGTAVNHLAPSFLRLQPTFKPNSNPTPWGRASSQNKGVYNPQGDRSGPRFNFVSHSRTGQIICKRFNGWGGCSFKGCKFEHICNVPGCGLPHQGVKHSESKNR